MEYIEIRWRYRRYQYLNLNNQATGVGGINRDIFTMGARPIAQMNSLRFFFNNTFFSTHDYIIVRCVFFIFNIFYNHISFDLIVLFNVYQILNGSTFSVAFKNCANKEIAPSILNFNLKRITLSVNHYYLL